MKNEKYYYKVHLEVSLKTSDYIFGVINISHIPYDKFEEMFMEQVRHEHFLFDDSMSYIIDKKLYRKYKTFLEKEVPFTFDFKLFDYSVSLTGDKLSKLKKYYYEDLPPFFQDR